MLQCTPPARVAPPHRAVSAKRRIMAQYYTLEEASRALGMSVDAFRKKLATEWRNTPRRYPDGATLRFQAREIDELARTLGRHSDADLQPADAPLKLADDHGAPAGKK